MIAITIKATTTELSALGEALELADSLVSNSEYEPDHRAQAAEEKNACRRAWKIYNRLWDAIHPDK